MSSKSGVQGIELTVGDRYLLDKFDKKQKKKERGLVGEHFFLKKKIAHQYVYPCSICENFTRASLTYVCFVPANGLIKYLLANSSNIAFEVPLVSK